MSKSELTDRKRTLIFINILISCIASSLLATALTTALPPIMADLEISVTMGQWLTSGYSLVMGITMPLTAFLITRFPSRRLYITSIIIFILGLVICVLAPSFQIMMCGRVLQACGNGILTSMAQVVLLSIYPSEKRGTVMGWYGLSVGAAPVIAPTLAGVLVDLFGWRSIFYVSIVIMLVSLMFAWRVFGDVLNTVEKRFDVVSFILSALAFGGLTLGIGNVSSAGLFSLTSGGAIGIGIVASCFFAWRQLHMDMPFLELRTLKEKDYAISVLGSMLLYFVMMGSSILMPLYVQNVLGKSATISGLVTLPGSLAMAIVSPFAGRLFDRLGIKKLFLAGSIALLISNVGMFFIGLQTPVWVAGMWNVVRCVAIGCLMMPLVTWGNSSLPQEMVAHGTALLTSFRTIAGAIGSAVFVGVMTAVAAHSASAYGEGAQMHGLNISYLGMTVFSVIMLAIAVFCVKEKSDADRT